MLVKIGGTIALLSMVAALIGYDLGWAKQHDDIAGFGAAIFLDLLVGSLPLFAIWR